MIDCSHANSQKQHERQVDVARDIAAQIAGGDARICRRDDRKPPQSPAGRTSCPGKPLHYGVSITDACIGWDTTVDVLHALADAVRPAPRALAGRRLMTPRRGAADTVVPIETELKLRDRARRGGGARCGIRR